jgi:hypothetical protein
MFIPVGFKFHEDIPPKEVPPQVTLDQRLQELQTKDKELYSVVFGKGLTKGKKEVTDLHLQEAKDERYEKTHRALAEERIHRMLLEKAKEHNFLHPEDCVDLLQSALTLDDNLDIVYASTGEKISLDDAVKNIGRVKPHWIASKQKQGIGSKPPVPLQGNSNTDKPVFKRSQLRDHAFYMAHESEIMAAARDSRIVDE